MLDSEERRLLARAQRGDMLAFEALVRMHQQRVYAHSYRLLTNSAEAEDLCAETFLRAFQHLGVLQADPSIIHWLLRVANNLGISLLRKRGARVMVALDEAQDVSTDMPTPEERMLEHNQQQVIRRCLNRLAPKERIAVLMFYLDERPLEEIAGVLGCGMAGAKSRVHRARHHLRALVKAELGEDMPLGVGEEGQLC